MTEDLQYRLYNYTIPPPGDAWPNIALQLDKDAQQKLALKMQEAVLEPPASVWNKIVSALEETSQAPVIPIGRKWTRVAVAAMAIGIIALAALSYYLLGPGQGDMVTATPKNRPAPAAINNRPQTEPIVVRNPAVYSNIAAGKIASFAGGLRRVLTNSIRYARVENTGLSASEAGVNMDGLTSQQLSIQPITRIAPKEYLTVAAPNGQPARISARFSDGLNCLLNNEPTLTMDMALKSIAWKMRFTKWNNKLLASTGFIPTASNFLDIVEMEELFKDQ